MNQAKQWSPWIELPFNQKGVLDTSLLATVPNSAGVYAIASKESNGLYVTHYVGRSCRSIRERLQKHLRGHGNTVIASQLLLKRSVPLAPASMCVAYLETTEPKIVEAFYIDADDRPICNLIKARLPVGLSETFVRRSELEE